MVTEQSTSIPDTVTDDVTQTDITSGNQNNNALDNSSTCNGIQSHTNGISELNGVISDPRGFNDVENHNATELFYETQCPHEDRPPPYPGLPRISTGHLRQYDEISRLRRIQTFPGNFQDSTRAVPIASERTRNIALNNIPNMATEDDQTYINQMHFTLCLLISCILVCNFTSIIFTFPATVFAWKAVKAFWRHQYQVAERNRNIAIVCNCIVILHFILISLLFLIIFGIYILVRDDILTVNTS